VQYARHNAGEGFTSLYLTAMLYLW